MIDQKAKLNEIIYGIPVLNDLPYGILKYHVAIGDNRERKRLAGVHSFLEYISIYSESASIGFQTSIRQGCFLAPFSFIGPESIIGSGTIVNTSAVIEHEVKTGSFCHIAPHVTVCGRSQLGNNVFLGAGSVVIDNISICDDVIVGANSTVTTDINTPGTYVGSPARIVSCCHE